VTAKLRSKIGQRQSPQLGRGRAELQQLVGPAARRVGQPAGQCPQRALYRAGVGCGQPQRQVVDALVARLDLAIVAWRRPAMAPNWRA